VWTNEETVAAGHSIDPARWREAFAAAMGRIAGRFADFPDTAFPLPERAELARAPELPD
jgi:hypothetical protein